MERGRAQLDSQPAPEAAVLCGIQGAGKSTFYIARFFQTHVRISQDLLRTPNRMQRMLDLCLETRQPFAVDRVNATPEDRRPFVEAARAAGFMVAAYWVDAPPGVAIERNAARAGRARVPVKAVLGSHRRLVAPAPEEGFDAVWHVRADGAGGFTVTPIGAREPGPAGPAEAGADPDGLRLF